MFRDIRMYVCIYIYIYIHVYIYTRCTYTCVYVIARICVYTVVLRFFLSLFNTCSTFLPTSLSFLHRCNPPGCNGQRPYPCRFSPSCVADQAPFYITFLPPLSSSSSPRPLPTFAYPLSRGTVFLFLLALFCSFFFLPFVFSSSSRFSSALFRPENHPENQHSRKFFTVKQIFLFPRAAVE